MMPFEPNAEIVVRRFDGRVERIRVRCETDDDGQIAPGPCYTEVEWSACDPADWEYDKELGLCFQGRPGAPYNFATCSFYRIGSLFYAEARDSTTGTLRERGPKRTSRREAQADARALRKRWVLATRVSIFEQSRDEQVWPPKEKP